MVEISDVVKAKLSDIQTTPKFGSALDTEYISGLADAGGKMLMLLDIDTMLRVSEMNQLSKGQTVKIQGTYDGYGKNIIVKDCILV